MILILYIIIFIAFIIPIKTIGNNTEWLSKESTNKLKGIASIFIIIHHLSILITHQGFLHQFDYIGIISGYLLVGIFFFVSGYGMEASDSNLSGHLNIRKFLNRILRIGVPYLTVSILYFSLSFILYGYQINFIDIFRSINTGDPLIKYSWFSIAIIIIYFLFDMSSFVAFKLSLNKYIILFFFLCLYCYILYNIGFGEEWYNSVFIVMVGSIFNKYKAKIENWLINRKWSLVVLSIILNIGIAYQILFSNSLDFINYIYLFNALVKEFTLINFVVLIFFVSYFYTSENKLSLILSNCSYEIYLTHGLIILLFERLFPNMKMNLLLCVLIIVSTIFISYIEHYLNKTFFSIVKRVKGEL